MHELHAALLALQELDAEIARAEAKLGEFAPRLEALEAPVTSIERELEATRAKLADMRSEQQRLERNAQQKQDRFELYQDRLSKARNQQAEAAARAELDLVRGALEADRIDLRQIGEQATRTDMKADELEKNLERARTQIAEERAQLLAERDAAADEVAQLRDRRENQAVRLDPVSRRLYERVRSGKARTALAPLTGEGACGNCFNILPLQEQANVRGGETLHRCEACGVILYVAA